VKIFRIIMIILIVIWMLTIFRFSSQPACESSNTSGRTTKFIVIYGEDIEDFDKKTEKLDPVVRKIAHYTIYLVRRDINYEHDVNI